MIFYCFVAECFVGELNFKDDGDITMTWEDDKNLTPLALRYKKDLLLDTREHILNFIDERTPDMRRPGLAVFLSQVGCHMNSSPIEIFIADAGQSINDLFWINKVKSNKLWFDELRHNWNL